ncbi:sigma-54 interaction domain-containing protein [Phaeodactylibacter luteus]|uniref:Sigma-54-dependent Fis family transcriptional regulator n=1 Tax=Phaeodactylibacter luteus TaxID=1564516 RepID=A0A5C6RM86_9BACT|nr:sigma 54-interacting transcriptional regulator [Phaeodactylibacter luteus]TXB63478.1 sigma-54-dependent Fis family transcriptional regulator [Phaeodactylibacter luteus]
MDANLQSIKQRFGIIGRSPLLDRALSTSVRVANTDLSVLITGESGVGKEVFSKIIHSLSARKHNQFIAINCGAIPEGTINSELFGHEKGAFTGATGERKGYFETYDGGTIFLDEIGEMPLDTQAFLLRVLETGEFIRVGASKVHKTDVRIIAATNVSLLNAVKNGKFREDLYYRLNTVPVAVPPLRERAEDIYMLFRKFALDFAEKYRTSPIQLDEQARQMLESYSWPGNIRELKNIAEQASVMADEKVITAEKLILYVPQITRRNLPMIADGHTKGGEEQMSMQEREIFYKLMLDMKNDLNDLKSLVFELIRNNDLHVPDAQDIRALQPPASSSGFSGERNQKPASGSSRNVTEFLHDYHDEGYYPAEEAPAPESFRPIILNREEAAQHYAPTEEVEENLSLEENEKGLIQKALRKHNGRRKEAAADLGISERTLYRKIKQYEL